MRVRNQRVTEIQKHEMRHHKNSWNLECRQEHEPHFLGGILSSFPFPSLSPCPFCSHLVHVPRWPSQHPIYLNFSQLSQYLRCPSPRILGRGSTWTVLLFSPDPRSLACLWLCCPSSEPILVPLPIERACDSTRYFCGFLGLLLPAEVS